MARSKTHKVTLQYKNCPRTEDGQEIRASYKCNECKGKGKTFGIIRKCISCDGTGIINLVDCPDCLGTGANAKKGICSSCKGEKVVPQHTAHDLTLFKKWRAKFKENPVKALTWPIINIVLIALCSRTAWLYLSTGFVPDKFIDCVCMYAPLIAWFFLIFKCIDIFEGSRYDPERRMLRTVGLGIIGVGLLVSLIAGPLSCEKNELVVAQATEHFNKYRKGDNLTCTTINIKKRERFFTYYGDAILTTGDSIPVKIVVHTMNHYSYLYMETTIPKHISDSWK